MRFYSYSEDEIAYETIVRNINWFKHPTKPVPPRIVPVSGVLILRKKGLCNMHFFDIFFFLVLLRRRRAQRQWCSRQL